MNHSGIRKYYLSLLLVVPIWVWRVNFFLQFLVDFFDPWIRIRGSFCGSGSRKQNIADPTDSDPKHYGHTHTNNND